MDWGTGYLTIIVGTGAGHLQTKIARGVGHFNNFFKRPGYARGLPGGGMLAVGIDSHITYIDTGISENSFKINRLSQSDCQNFTSLSFRLPP